ncbi:MAG: hypothetical protein M0C28_03275 [Candidatus Moduliflexus flocculans]|nr:hypothetical protein [Candidatus Moduliflexus flocculans]
MVFGTYISSWQIKAIQDDPSTSADNDAVGDAVGYWVNGTEGSHGMTVVGYNDAVWTDVNGNGAIDAGEKGALRIANSWGSGWRDGGFTWLAYDALGYASSVAGGPSSPREPAFFNDMVFLLTVRDAYAPSMIAEFTVNHAQEGPAAGTSSGSRTHRRRPPRRPGRRPPSRNRAGPSPSTGRRRPSTGPSSWTYTDILVAGRRDAALPPGHARQHGRRPGDAESLQDRRPDDRAGHRDRLLARPQDRGRRRAGLFLGRLRLRGPGLQPPSGADLPPGLAGERHDGRHVRRSRSSTPTRTAMRLRSGTSTSTGSPTRRPIRLPTADTVGPRPGSPPASTATISISRTARAASARAPVAGSLTGPAGLRLQPLGPFAVERAGRRRGFHPGRDGHGLRLRRRRDLGRERPDDRVRQRHPPRRVHTRLRPRPGQDRSDRRPGARRRPVEPARFRWSRIRPRSLASISPVRANGGGAAFTLTVTGSNFVSNSSVLWNGVARTTTLRRRHGAPGLHRRHGPRPTGGEVVVSVSNPLPAGGSSAASAFTVSDFTVEALAGGDDRRRRGRTRSSRSRSRPGTARSIPPSSFRAVGLPRGCYGFVLAGRP